MNLDAGEGWKTETEFQVPWVSQAPTLHPCKWPQPARGNPAPEPGGAGKEEGLWKPKGSRPPSAQLRTWKHRAAMSGETPKGLLPCSRKALGRHCWLRVKYSKGQSGPFTAGASGPSLGRLNVASGLLGTQSIFSGDMAVSRWPQPGWLSRSWSAMQGFQASRRQLLNISTGKWIPSCNTKH